MQLVSPAPGTLASAREHLVDAQGAAANLANAPTTDTSNQLRIGLNAAHRSAEELLTATPLSKFQDLAAARDQVLEGAQLLEQAISSRTSAHHGVDPLKIKLLAGEAFDAFESAFEIIDND